MECLLEVGLGVGVAGVGELVVAVRGPGDVVPGEVDGDAVQQQLEGVVEEAVGDGAAGGVRDQLLVRLPLLQLLPNVRLAAGRVHLSWETEYEHHREQRPGQRGLYGSNVAEELAVAAGLDVAAVVLVVVGESVVEEHVALEGSCR